MQILITAEMMAKWRASAQSLGEVIADGLAILGESHWNAETIAKMEQAAREGAEEAWKNSMIPASVRETLTNHAVAAFVARLEVHATQSGEVGHA